MVMDMTGSWSYSVFVRVVALCPLGSLCRKRLTIFSILLSPLSSLYSGLAPVASLSRPLFLDINWNLILRELYTLRPLRSNKPDGSQSMF